MLFIGFSSAFNTIPPYKLRPKLHDLGLNTTLCKWFMDFLTNWTQCVKIGGHTSSTRDPQEYMLSPLLYTLFTHDCFAIFPSNHIVKFADDTMVLGLINNNNYETAYRNEVQHFASWCNNSSLVLNIKKPRKLLWISAKLNHTNNLLSLSPRRWWREWQI